MTCGTGFVTKFVIAVRCVDRAGFVSRMNGGKYGVTGDVLPSKKVIPVLDVSDKNIVFPMYINISCLCKINSFIKQFWC